MRAALPLAATLALLILAALLRMTIP